MSQTIQIPPICNHCGEPLGDSGFVGHRCRDRKIPVERVNLPEGNEQLLYQVVHLRPECPVVAELLATVRKLAADVEELKKR